MSHSTWSQSQSPRGWQRASKIGAGVQITPDAMRILDYLGLKDVFYREDTKDKGTILRMYSDGKLLGKHRANPLTLHHY